MMTITISMTMVVIDNNDSNSGDGNNIGDCGWYDNNGGVTTVTQVNF